LTGDYLAGSPGESDSHGGFLVFYIMACVEFQVLEYHSGKPIALQISLVAGNESGNKCYAVILNVNLLVFWRGWVKIIINICLIAGI